MTSRAVAAVAALVLASGTAPAQSPPAELVVYPRQIKLTGPRDEQRLIVLGKWADGRTRDLTRSASFASGNVKPRTKQIRCA